MQEKRPSGRLRAGHEVGQAVRSESLWQGGKVLLPGLSVRELPSRRAITAFAGGIIAMFGARLADG